MTVTGTPHSFEGVAKIVRFNARFYLLSAVTLGAAFLFLLSARWPFWLEGIILCGAVVAAFWTLTSLLVSWYVYDHVGVTRWQWLPGLLAVSPQRWVNIHAGLDESTESLRQLFAGTEGTAIDIFESCEMHEPSIARARRIHPSTEPFTSGSYDALPLPANECDAIFLLFAAHEIRDAERRTKLLSETARVLRTRGQVILVEHLRDWKNLIAFGPGFLHFHSRSNWLRSIHNAGLIVAQENQVTPFVRCFVLRRANQ